MKQTQYVFVYFLSHVSREYDTNNATKAHRKHKRKQCADIKQNQKGVH